MRVLLIECIPDYLELIPILLKRRLKGAEIECLPNGNSAIEKLNAGERWDLIISAYLMPAGNGYDVLQAVISSQLNTPVLIFTNHSIDREIAQQFKDLPAQIIGGGDVPLLMATAAEILTMRQLDND